MANLCKPITAYDLHVRYNNAKSHQCLCATDLNEFTEHALLLLICLKFCLHFALLTAQLFYLSFLKSSSGGGVPKTPTCTPATPVHHQRWTSSPRKGVRTVPITEYSMYGWADSPCMYPHPPVNTPNTPKTGQSAGLNSDQGKFLRLSGLNKDPHPIHS